MRSLNTSPIVVTSAAVVDLISGASLAGLTGVVSPSPKVRVTGVSAYIPGGTFTHTLTLYKGVSGGSDPSTQVLQSTVNGQQLSADLDVILEAGEVLTATAASSGGATSITVFVSADISF